MVLREWSWNNSVFITRGLVRNAKLESKTLWPGPGGLCFDIPPGDFVAEGRLLREPLAQEGRVGVACKSVFEYASQWFSMNPSVWEQDFGGNHWFSFPPTFTFPLSSSVSELLSHCNSLRVCVFFWIVRPPPKKEQMWSSRDRVMNCPCDGTPLTSALKVPWPRKPLSLGHSGTVGHPRWALLCMLHCEMLRVWNYNFYNLLMPLLTLNKVL